MNESGRRFEFRCPHCGECVRVDAEMAELLGTAGCIACGGPVSDEAFSTITDA